MMDDKHRHALALLRAGCSYGEASDRTGLTLEEVMDLWKEDEMKSKVSMPKPKPAPAKPVLKPTYSPRGGGNGSNNPPPEKK